MPKFDVAMLVNTPHDSDVRLQLAVRRSRREDQRTAPELQSKLRSLN